MSTRHLGWDGHVAVKVPRGEVGPMGSPFPDGLPSNVTVGDRSNMSTVQSVILTADQKALADSYTQLCDAEEIFRVPEEGPVFYLGLRIGDTDLGLVAKADAEPRQRRGSC